MAGNNPIGRGLLRTKCHVLRNQNGISPLSIVISIANTYDTKIATGALDEIVIIRQSLHKDVQNLCLDK